MDMNVIFKGSSPTVGYGHCFALIYSDANVYTKLWSSYGHQTAAG